MGRRGPAPIPTEVRRAKGETRPCRVGRSQPAARRIAPTIPPDLDERGERHWRHVLREMPVGVIRAADRDILRAYVDAVVLYEESVKMLMGSGPLIQGARTHGELVRNPLHQVVRDNRDAIRLFARELGLSPAARVGLSIDGGFPASDPRGWESTLETELGPTPRQLRVVNGDDE